jgi:hypothetical protein
VAQSGGTFLVPLLIASQHAGSLAGKALSVSRRGVNGGLCRRLLIVLCHQLAVRRAGLRRYRGASLAQPVRAALRESGFVALCPKPVAKPGRREWLAEFRHKRNVISPVGLRPMMSASGGSISLSDIRSRR